MKETITEDQWGELNEKQQLIIAEKFAFQNVTQSPEFYVGNPGVYYPLNIGQMIEFLNERRIEATNHDGDWLVFVWDRKHAPEFNEADAFICRDLELADCLWQAVKEILNQ